VRPSERRRWLLGVAAGWACGGALAAEAWGLDALMQMLAQVRSGEARFTERRTVAGLDRTLESSGRLSFAAPDTFVRETLKPRPDRLAVDGNTLVMSQGGRSRTVQLDATPEAQVMVEAIRGTLTGNGELLQRYFDVRVGGGRSAWSLQLVPRDARLRGQVAQVLVNGQQAALKQVEVLLTDGDRSVMVIEPAAPAAVR
jgi:outer membrane lipoprotein-sorting protein